ncbi:MAG: aspartate aminotransferase family protein [Caldilineales bacterium]|nr:aspartate aminotransferase family protein [Caldilineales bacterium]
MPATLAATGQTKQQVFAALQDARQQDVNWQEGRAFSLVFQAGEDVAEISKRAYEMYFSENGLNPGAFPSLRRFEAEVLAMVAGLLGGDGETVGNMTSGGTESILMAVYTARQWARANRPAISVPEIIMPVSGHPAFEKAAHYFDTKIVHIPVRADFRADVEAMQAAITPNTIMLVGSAPSYPQGVIDPIAEIAALAAANGLLCHVDACVGGLMLPFVRKLGYPISDFDFSTPGVTSISADLHKYGYTAKGASVILYRHKDLRRHQMFAFCDWPGGIYASPTMAGTRPGGAIASAWAVMNYLGEEGYLHIAEEVMQTATKLRQGIAAIDDVHVLSDPDMSVMAIAADRLDVYQIGDELSVRGWHLDRQQSPPSLHLTLHRGHTAIADEFLSDLAAAVAEVKRPTPRRVGTGMLLWLITLITKILPERWLSWLVDRAAGMLGGGGSLPKRSAAMYGMMGVLPNRGDLQELVLDLVEGFTTPPEKSA